MKTDRRKTRWGLLAHHSRRAAPPRPRWRAAPPADCDGRAGAEAADDYYQLVIERQRRTIRALVVAARVARLAAVGFAFIAGVGPTRVHDEIRFGIKQADRQAKE